MSITKVSPYRTCRLLGSGWQRSWNRIDSVSPCENVGLDRIKSPTKPKSATQHLAPASRPISG